MKEYDRFLSFKAYDKEKYTKIFSKFTARYTQWVRFDDKEYVNTKNNRYLPYNILEPFEYQLPTDSRNRKDIKLLRDNRADEAQEEKERI